MQMKKNNLHKKIIYTTFAAFFLRDTLLYIAYEQKFGNSRVSGEGEDD